jgi:spermidine synthase
VDVAHPPEILTLREGTRLAKGRVVIAGLGLGHQLIEVSKRFQVKEIVLVEQSQELVDFYLPRVRSLVKKKLTVIVGDAYEVVPTLSADVALIDIFPGYGHNEAATRELARRSPKIKKMWGWGTAAVRP